LVVRQAAGDSAAVPPRYYH